MVKKVTTLAVAGLLALPSFVSAGAGPNVQDLERKIQDLSKQLEELKANVAEQKATNQAQ